MLVIVRGRSKTRWMKELEEGEKYTHFLFVLEILFYFVSRIQNYFSKIKAKFSGEAKWLVFGWWKIYKWGKHFYFSIKKLESFNCNVWKSDCWFIFLLFLFFVGIIAGKKVIFHRTFYTCRSEVSEREFIIDLNTK